jgi:chromosome segregation ATPase
MSTYRTKCDAMIAVAEERAEAAEKALASERARAEKAELHIAALEKNEREVWMPAAETRDQLTAALATARREAQEARSALGEAASSLRWIAERRCSLHEEPGAVMWEVRQYARSRADVASRALASPVAPREETPATPAKEE